MPLALELTGPLDRAAMVRALDVLVDRHRALRTRYVAGEPDGRIDPPGTPFALSIEDLTGRPDAEARLAALEEREATAPFDLAAGPPARGRLVVLAPDRHVLLFTVHETVAGGTSMDALTRELGVLYEAYRSNLPEPPAADDRRLQAVAMGARTTAYPVKQPLHVLFQSQVARDPDAVAVVHEGGALSYGELNARANRLAHHLRDRGVGPERLVAVCLERSVDLVVALLAVLKAGGAYLPLDPAHPPARLAFMLDDASPALLLAHGPTRAVVDPALAGAPVPVVDLDADAALWAGRPDTDPDRHEVRVTLGNLAYVMYTSGGTGQPDGAMVEHAGVVRLFAATGETHRFGPEDVWALYHPFASRFSVWEMWGALLHGGRLVVVPGRAARDPSACYALVCAEGVTVLTQPPSALRGLVAAQAESVMPHRLRVVVLGGETLDPGTLRRWYADPRNAGTELVSTYGRTETTVHVTYRPLTPADADRPGVPIGRPLGDMAAHVLDADGEPAPDGAVGELYVGGAGLARGYLNRPDITADRFVDNPFVPADRLFRTGDLARRRADGELEYVGRERITPGMVPLVALDQDEIDAVVATVPGGVAGVADIYPLAPAQQGALFQHLVTGGDAPYLVTNLIRFADRSRLDAYRAALDGVVARHELLRSSVVWRGIREPVQVVWRTAPPPVEEVALDPGGPGAGVQLRAHFRDRYDRLRLDRAPPLRLLVAYDPRDDNWYALVQIGHLVDDDTARLLLAEEIQAHLYGRADELPPPPSLREFVAGSRRGSDPGAQEAFFARMLAGIDAPTTPFGPADGPTRHARQTVDAALASRLRMAAARLDVNVTSLFHVAWGHVLGRSTGRTDVVFGTVVSAAHGVAGIERAFGPFANTLPLRVTLDGTGTADRVRRTDALLIELVRHEYASLELAQRASAVVPPVPLFTARLFYRRAVRPAGQDALTTRDGTGVTVLWAEETGTYPLALDVEDRRDSFALTVAVRGAVVDPRAVCAMAHRALSLLADALERAPDRPIRDLEVPLPMTGPPVTVPPVAPAASGPAATLPARTDAASANAAGAPGAAATLAAPEASGTAPVVPSVAPVAPPVPAAPLSAAPHAAPVPAATASGAPAVADAAASAAPPLQAATASGAPATASAAPPVPLASASVLPAVPAPADPHLAVALAVPLASDAAAPPVGSASTAAAPPVASEPVSVVSPDPVTGPPAEGIGADGLGPVAHNHRLPLAAAELVTPGSAVSTPASVAPAAPTPVLPPELAEPASVAPSEVPGSVPVVLTDVPGRGPVVPPVPASVAPPGSPAPTDVAARAVASGIPDGRRAFAEGTATVALAGGSEPTTVRWDGTHHPVRRFADVPVPAGALGGTLASLSVREVDGSLEFLYDSAGGGYPVQAYLFVKPGRVEGVAGGAYYHDPYEHRLVELGRDRTLDPDCYDRATDRPVYESGAFALFLVAEMATIEPRYGPQSLGFCRIEAGAMAQLLTMASVGYGLGLCGIGTLDAVPLEELFDLGPTHRLIYSLVGGVRPA